MTLSLVSHRGEGFIMRRKVFTDRSYRRHRMNRSVHFISPSLLVRLEPASDAQIGAEEGMAREKMPRIPEDAGEEAYSINVRS